VELIELADNTGFAHAANRGLSAAASEFVALINPDVVLAPDWLEQMTDELCAHPDAASVACKMVALEDPTTLDDAGDVLRRDGVCAQRGRFTPDDGRFDRPGEVFGACAGAALYRAPAVNAVGGFDERYFAYLEDVDLALRLALAGWRCRYRPAVARHASEGSARRRPGMREFLATRNTIYLMAKAFPLRWLHLVLYRQASWLWHAGRERRLRAHLRALVAALPMLGHAIAQRRGLRSAAAVPIEIVVPAGPIRGPAIP
jgi:GT2 family glycosyltransferase